MTYYLLIDSLKKAIYRLPRTGSTSLVTGIVDQFYADARAKGSVRPPGVPDDDIIYVPRTPAPPDDYEKLLVLRDPVERFRSACGITGKTPAEAIALMRAGTPDVHFEPAPKGVEWGKVFRFEDGLRPLADYLGMPALPALNASETKPDLTPDELAYAQTYYSDDLALWDQLSV